MDCIIFWVLQRISIKLEFSSHYRANCFQSLNNVDFFLYIFVGEKYLVVKSVFPYVLNILKIRPSTGKKIGSARTSNSNLLADVYILQESEPWDIIFCRGTNLARCEVGVVLSAKQTS